MRINVVGFFANDDAIERLVAAFLLEQCARCMTLETNSQMSDDPLIILPTVAR